MTQTKTALDLFAGFFDDTSETIFLFVQSLIQQCMDVFT